MFVVAFIIEPLSENKANGEKKRKAAKCRKQAQLKLSGLIRVMKHRRLKAEMAPNSTQPLGKHLPKCTGAKKDAGSRF